MSLHLNQQCQRADALPPPVRLFRASVVPTKKRRETNARPLHEAASACWRGIYGWPSDASTGFLQLYCSSPWTRLRAPFWLLHADSTWRVAAVFQGLTPGIPTFSAFVSGALNVRAHRVGFRLDPLHPVLHQVADRDNP